MKLCEGCPSVRNLLIFSCTFVIFFCGYFFRFAIAPIVDVLETDLNTTASGIGILGSFIQLFYFAVQIPVGILLQFIAPKYIIPIASITFAVSSFLFALSETVAYATIMSSINGLASAPLWLSFLRIIDDTFTRKQVPFAIGIQMLLTYGGLFSCNYLQAVLYTNYNDWRSTFYALSGASIVSAILFVLLTYCDCTLEPINRPHPYRSSLRKPSEHEQTITMTNTGQSTKTNHVDEDEAMYKSLLSDSSMRTGNAANYKERLRLIRDSFKRAICLKLNWILSIWGFSGLVLVMSFNGLWFINYLMIKFKYSRATATVISGSFYLMRAVCAPIYGCLAMRYSKRKIFLIVGSFLCLCTVVIIYVSHSSTPILFIVTLNLISGIGSGNYGIMWTLQREYNSYYECKDTAAGLVNTIINSAGFVGQLFIGEMLDVHWNMRDGDKNEKGDRIYIVSDFQYALIIIPIVVGLAILTSFLLKETNAQNIDYEKKQSAQSAYMSESSSTATTTMMSSLDRINRYSE